MLLFDRSESNGFNRDREDTQIITDSNPAYHTQQTVVGDTATKIAFTLVDPDGPTRGDLIDVVYRVSNIYIENNSRIVGEHLDIFNYAGAMPDARTYSDSYDASSVEDLVLEVGDHDYKVSLWSNGTYYFYNAPFYNGEPGDQGQYTPDLDVEFTLRPIEFTINANYDNYADGLWDGTAEIDAFGFDVTDDEGRRLDIWSDRNNYGENPDGAEIIIQKFNFEKGVVDDPHNAFFVDDPHNALEGYDFRDCLEKHGIEDVLKISSKSGENIIQLKETIFNSIDWRRIPKTVQSNEFKEVSNLIDTLPVKKPGIRTVSLDELQQMLDIQVSKRHLKYILTTLTNQGIIEYVPELKQIIINDERFNDLKSKIPERIGNNGGFYKSFQLINELSGGDLQLKAYIRYYIQKLQNNLEIIVFHDGVPSKEIIIVPRLLHTEDFDFPIEYVNLLPETEIKSFISDQLEFPWYNFLDSIKDYYLDIIQITRDSLIMSSKNKSFCFQILIGRERVGRKKKLKISLIIGGLNEKVIAKKSKRLRIDLLKLFPDVDSDNAKIFLVNDFNLESDPINKPTAYISYVHGSEEHQNWIHGLAEDLQINGVRCIIDQWQLFGGKQHVEFMKQIDIVDKIIIICEPNLVRKLESNESSGIRFEFMYINKRMLRETTAGKSIIPIIKEGSVEEALPSILRDYCIYIDFRDAEEYNENLKLLIKSIWDQPNRLPPSLGQIPDFIER